MSELKTPVVTLPHSEVFLREDGLVQVNASNRSYSVNDIKEIHAAVGRVNNNQKALLLLVAHNFTSVDSEAREFLSTPEAGAHSVAEAYVIKSLAQRLLLNFLIKVNGTPVPVKFFTESGPAIAWLNTFNNKRQSEQLNMPSENLSNKV